MSIITPFFSKTLTRTKCLHRLKLAPYYQTNYFHSSRFIKGDDHHNGKSMEYSMSDKNEPFRFPTEKFEKYRRESSDSTTNKSFTYFVMATAGMTYATALKSSINELLSTMSPSADVLALANIEVDLSKIAEGTTATIKWRGKPLFIRHRTPEEIASAQQVDMSDLKDPINDRERAKKPEWLVVLGVCTHLGCVPLPGQGEFGGWFCPCHGSHYDTSGRIRKGPAPRNLEIPPYNFIDENLINVGD